MAEVTTDLCTTLLLCRKLSPRATARATSLPLLYQSNSCASLCSSRQRALRRSPPCNGSAECQASALIAGGVSQSAKPSA